MPDVGYLGPPGTYSHLVATKRFGSKAKYVGFVCIFDVCDFVAAAPRERAGIVPIENSSGGAIYETVDILLAGAPAVTPIEEITLNVTLALIGRENETIRTLISHFAQMEHCAAWIRERLPGVSKQTAPSTTAAAIRAATETGTACLGNRRLASLYNLSVLEYPVQTDCPNITSFYRIGDAVPEEAPPTKTTLAARIPNRPGALFDLLAAFRKYSINLSRLLSRPIRESHREYQFLLDIDGGMNSERVRNAVQDASSVCTALRVVGSYPCRRRYHS